jgi:hypothetical protein
MLTCFAAFIASRKALLFALQLSFPPPPPPPLLDDGAAAGAARAPLPFFFFPAPLKSSRSVPWARCFDMSYVFLLLAKTFSHTRMCFEYASSLKLRPQVGH